MAALVGIAVFLVVLVSICFAAWACLNWTLGPLDRAAKNRQYPIQFGLADLLCLFVLVQLPAGIAHWMLREYLHEGVVVLDVVLGVIATLVWWVSLRTLSRAGIHVVWQRCVVLTLVLPGAYVSSIATIALPVAAFALLMGQRSSVGGWLLLAEIPLACILYGFGRFTRAIVASSKEV